MKQAEVRQHPGFVIVLTTLPAAHDAAALARTLVEEHLAACVNIQAEMESVYRWRGQVEQDRERQVVIKTRAVRVDDLIARVRQLHPYEVPEVLVIPVLAGSDTYLDWVSAATEGPSANPPGR